MTTLGRRSTEDGRQKSRFMKNEVRSMVSFGRMGGTQYETGSVSAMSLHGGHVDAGVVAAEARSTSGSSSRSDQGTEASPL